MEPEEKEGVVERIEVLLKDAVGLPPGDGTPHGKGRPIHGEDVPRGTLTSDDAEGLPPHAGTGIAVE